MHFFHGPHLLPHSSTQASISRCPTQPLWYVAPSPFSQPVMPSLLPLGHWLHFMPVIPVLQEHSPVICSQSSRTEPTGSQLQAEQEGKKDTVLLVDLRSQQQTHSGPPATQEKSEEKGPGEDHNADCYPVLTDPTPAAGTCLHPLPSDHGPMACDPAPTPQPPQAHAGTPGLIHTGLKQPGRTSGQGADPWKETPSPSQAALWGSNSTHAMLQATLSLLHGASHQAPQKQPLEVTYSRTNIRAHCFK